MPKNKYSLRKFRFRTTRAGTDSLLGNKTAELQHWLCEKAMIFMMRFFSHPRSWCECAHYSYYFNFYLFIFTLWYWWRTVVQFTSPSTTTNKRRTQASQTNRHPFWLTLRSSTSQFSYFLAMWILFVFFYFCFGIARYEFVHDALSILSIYISLSR